MSKRESPRTRQAPSKREQHPRADTEPNPKRSVRKEVATTARKAADPVEAKQKGKPRAKSRAAVSSPGAAPKPDRKRKGPEKVPSEGPVAFTPAPAARKAQNVQPVKVDGRNRRSDDDALEGGFCEIVAGEHDGVHGTFDQVVEYDHAGYPVKVLVKPRDAATATLVVNYSDVRPDSAGRR